MNYTPKRGGKRENAGAPKKAETVVRSYRCRPGEIPAIKSAIKKEITKLRSQQYETNKTTITPG